tara:strand:- start:421 stop:525 length:105 start_codon:yes stop_codon:yes gene_type:complete
MVHMQEVILLKQVVQAVAEVLAALQLLVQETHHP